MYNRHSRTKVNDKGVCFHFPELKTYFKPKISNVMLIKASLIQHATKIRVGHVCLYVSIIFSYVAESS
jgi:hypothetical protein